MLHLLREISSDLLLITLLVHTWYAIIFLDTITLEYKGVVEEHECNTNSI